MLHKLMTLLRQNQHRLVLMSLASLQVFVNFFTTITIVKYAGFGSELDVFYIAMTVFFFLSSSITWSIASVLTPLLIQQTQGDDVAGKMFVNVALAIIPITALAFLTVTIWSKFLFINYLDVIDFKDIWIIQGFLLATFCVDGLTLVLYAVLQKKNRYITINLFNLVASISGFIMVYLLIDSFGIYVAAANQLLIKIIIFILMGVVVFPQIYKSMSFDKTQFLLIWQRCKYLLLGSLYYRIDETAERFIASYLTTGFVSLVAFVQRIYGAIITVINAGIGVPTITMFSNLVKNKEYVLIKKTLWKYVLGLLVVDLIIFIGIIFVGEYLILYLLDGEIAEGLKPILSLAIMLLFSIVFGKTISQVLQALLLSMRREKLITIWDSTTFTINLFVKIIFTLFWGMEGLLIAIMLGVLITDGAKMYLIHRELGKEL